MYKSFYKLTENPFNLTPDPQFLYLSSVHKRAMAYLHYSLTENKGFSVVTGEIGAGKTMVVKAIMAQFQEQVRIAHITNPSPDPEQLLRMIAEEYEIDQMSGSLSAADLIKMIHGFLLKRYAEGSKVVLIIDEAQRLLVHSLEEIRLLSNLETEKDKLIHIILVGQPELRNLLASPQLKQMRQRVSLWFHIIPLSFEETAEYIQHRLSRAGCSRSPFSRSAVRSIYRASGGIPRIINIASDAALLAGYVEQKHKIKSWLVEKVLDELNLKAGKEGRKKFSFPWKSNVPKTIQHPRLKEELESLAHDVNSLYRKYRQRVREQMPKQLCFPDDLSSLEDREFEDTVILAQAISLSLAVNELRKRIVQKENGRRLDQPVEK
ncbi:MAG: AAA family ATPase [bacterium]